MTTQLFTSHISTQPSFRSNTITDLRSYLQRIDLPHSSALHCPNTIHISGTKGKGSTANYCDLYIRQRYPKLVVGLYTSPHLCNICERIRLNGKPIPESMFNCAYWKIYDRLNKFKNKENFPALPGFYRMITLTSLYIFAHVKINNKPLDIMILEVGVGGRYDATNVLNHKNTVCGVTYIDFDHVNILGKTLEKIAFEKGGIFKKDKGEEYKKSFTHNNLSKNICFTVGSNYKDVTSVLQECAIKEGYKLEIVPPNKQIKYVFSDTCGYRLYNYSLAIALSNAVLHNMDLDEAKSHDIYINKCIPGRNHSISTEFNNNMITDKYPDIILHCDGAHTSKSVKYCMEWFKHVSNDKNNANKKILVFHCSMDKNPVLIIDEIVSCGFLDAVYFCQPNSMKTVRNRKYSRELFLEFGIEEYPDKDEFNWYDTLEVIWSYFEKKYGLNNIDILKRKNFDDVIYDLKTKYDKQIDVCVTGSIHLVGSAMKTIGWKEKDADCYLAQQL